MVGSWQNIGPVIDGKIPYVKCLACSEENGKTVLYAGCWNWNGIYIYVKDSKLLKAKLEVELLKWSEDTHSWTDIGYNISRKLLEHIANSLSTTSGSLGFGGIVSVRCLAVHPTNPNIIYAGIVIPVKGIARTYIAKTTDGGKTWSLHYVCDSLGLASIAISNKNPDVIYVGTYNGLLKSVDGGKTWKLLDNGILTERFIVWTVAIDPNNDSIIFAGGEDQRDPSHHVPRLFYSNNSGESWQEITPPGIWNPLDIEFDPKNPRIIYVATEGRGVFCSKDGGKTWKRLGRLNGLLSEDVSEIEIDPTNPQVIYAGTLTYCGGPGGVFRSDDSGKSWQEFNEGLRPGNVVSLAISKDGKILYAATIYDPNNLRGGVWRLKLE
jgi:hypothetical protein